MKKAIILFCFTLFFIIKIHAQTTLYEAKVDSITYNHYLQSNWNELIKTGKEAFKDSADFYYLRVRMGLAYFYKKDYINAIIHFEKAEEKNYLNDFLIEYLYLSSLYSADYVKAYKYHKLMSADKKISLQVPEKFPRNEVSINSLIIFTDNKINSNFDFTENDNIYAEAFIPNQAFGYSFDMSHYFKSMKWGISGGVNYQNFSMLNFFQVPEKPLLPPPIPKPEEITHTFKNTLQQTNINIAIPVNISSKTNIEGRFTYINTNFNVTEADTVQVSISDLLIPSIKYLSVDYKFEDKIKTTNDFLISLAFMQKIKKFKIVTNSSYFKITDMYKIQNGLNLWYYPKGNLNLYLSAGCYYQTVFENKTTLGGNRNKKPSKSSLQNVENNLVYNITFGSKLFSKLWFESYASFGQIKDYLEENGLHVYNSSYYDKWKAKTKLIFLVTDKLKINVSAEIFRKEMIYLNYKSSTEYPIPETKKVLYNDYLINGGIKWNF